VGFALQSLSSPEEPCRLSTAFCSLAGSTPTALSDAKTPAISDRLHPSRRPPAAADPAKGLARRRRGREARAPPAVISGHLSFVRVAPHADLGDQPESSGSPARSRDARLEALLPPEARSRGQPHARRDARAPRRSDDLRPCRCPSCPEHAHSHRAGALLGFAPPEPSPPRPRVRSTAGYARRLSRTLPEDHAPLRTTERSASILRLKSPETGGSVGWPPEHSTGGRCTASAPPFGRRPFLSCPSPTPSRREPRGIVVDCRGLKTAAVGQSRTWRPASSLGVQRFLERPGQWRVYAALGL
jgi:hypothetical protein